MIRRTGIRLARPPRAGGGHRTVARAWT